MNLPTLFDATRVEQTKLARMGAEKYKESIAAKPIPRTKAGFVQGLLGNNPHGELGEAFIVEAIRHYSKMIVDQDLPPEGPLADPNQLTPQKWQRIASSIFIRTTQFIEQ